MLDSITSVTAHSRLTLAPATKPSPVLLLGTGLGFAATRRSVPEGHRAWNLSIHRERAIRVTYFRRPAATVQQLRLFGRASRHHRLLLVFIQDDLLLDLALALKPFTACRCSDRRRLGGTGPAASMPRSAVSAQPLWMLVKEPLLIGDGWRGSAAFMNPHLRGPLGHPEDRHLYGAGIGGLAATPTQAEAEDRTPQAGQEPARVGDAIADAPTH